MRIFIFKRIERVNRSRSERHKTEEVVARINEFAAKIRSAHGSPVGAGNTTSFKTDYPTSKPLQGITTDKPVFIKAYDGHSAWANRRALELAGVSNKTVYTDFGELVKDKHGALTGALREHAMGLVSSHIPPLTRAEQLGAIRKGLALAASLGIWSVQDAGVDADEFRCLPNFFETTKWVFDLRCVLGWWN